MTQRIDIIIPAYNAHDTILRTLSSIAMQTIRDDLDVTIVDDCSDHDYSSFVSMFAPHMSIREIRLETNGGPGVARQYGIDHTLNPLLAFIDADDTFSDAFALQELRKLLEDDPKAHMCVGTFIEESANSTYITHHQDIVWIFGKLYSRAFLDKYQIRFNDTRANEDNGFNRLIKLLSNENEQIKFVPNAIYYWHSRPDSITRRNNREYAFNQSILGYTDNMIYAITEARKRNPFNSAINLFVVEAMCNLYVYYVQCVAKAPKFAEQTWASCRKFYGQMYAPIEKDVNEHVLTTSYRNAIRNEYIGDKFDMIPCMDFRTFLAKLKKETEDTTNIVKTTKRVSRKAA